MQFDTLIINGKIVDGTGKSAFKADVGILNQKIAAIGSLKSSEAKKVINADSALNRTELLLESESILTDLNTE